ncbi:methylenetetrahydrofolate reductase [Corynebacterium macginleyi]|nr:methylenetetrahydrofolate reductase [Corynebacterium macginleyi]MBK4143102.1 methylenetetrahydrofolate reductase [Corynebacterium macginleyi]MBK4144104.1 methylenetetrahydrofolate reductase [Corynebacterium macginleyi]MBK4146202.1 methylenetetrahydrofolate reductase [Corynebacterium macginleyi]MBK4149265.1 methylenetetrahydrofolate reductase [Corynebacterium macginleyi]
MSEEELMVPERLALSFEVIPPRHDADEAKIDRLLEALESYHPDYIAVTSSQRSGWLAGTTNFIERISRTTSMRPLAHLACTAGSRTELIGWTNRLVDAGVRGLLALRGDLPEEGLPEHYPQHADELISLIRQLERQQAARFAAGRLAVGVACYPSGHVESKNEDEDFDVLLKKQRLGADFAITQLFFDAQDFLRFSQKARLAGVHIPLIPGIMPMTSLRRVERMGELSGLAVPERVRSALAAATTPEEEYETGMELTAELARDIVAGGASGLHIYTHNNPDNTHDLLTRIGVDNDQR